MYYRPIFLTSLLILLLNSIGMAQNIQQIPAFQSLSRYDNGQAFTVDSLSTQGVNVIVFYDPGCGHCQELGSDIAAKWDLWDSHISFYFVSMVSKEYVNQYINTYVVGLGDKPNVTFLHDAVGEFITLFDPQNFPSTYIYAASDGHLIQSYDGASATGEMEQHLKKK